VDPAKIQIQNCICITLVHYKPQDLYSDSG